MAKHRERELRAPGSLNKSFQEGIFTMFGQVKLE